MADLGPSVARVGIAVAFEVGVLAAVTSWLLGWRRMQPATVEAAGAETV
jgi:hypothetical protein